MAEAAAPTPLIVNGASSALGCFAIKLAKASNIHPITAIADGSHQYADILLAVKKGDTMVDYRNGVEKMQRDAITTLDKIKAKHAMDCISANSTWLPLTQLLDRDGGSRQ